jgi:hypothetical protein
MTRNTSRIVANLLLATAGVVAGYLVFRNPALRRAAIRLVKAGLATTLPGYLIQEVTAAWKETG